MTLQYAKALLEAAEKLATEKGLSLSMAVVDRHAHLIAFHRMDGAMLGTIDVAQRKAVTSTLFPMPSGDFGDLCRREALDGMMHSNGGLMGFPGGHPLPDGGAIGISGGTAQEDAEIALAAIAACTS